MSTAALDAPPEERVHNRQLSLQQRVLLLAPSFGCWRGRYVLSEDRVDVKLDNTSVQSEDVTTPCSVLMKDTCPVDSNGKAWKKRFSEVESAQKRLINAYSVPFPIHGVRIIPKSRGRSFFDALLGHVDGQRRPVFNPDLDTESQSVAFQLHTAAEEFCNTLPDVMRQIARDNPRVWDAVSARVPTNRSDMRKKFYVDAVPVELGGSGVANEVTEDDLANHNAVVRDACRRKVEEAVEIMVQGPRQELARALADLQNLIARDGRVTNRSFNGVREAIAKIRLFDFVADDALMRQISRVEQRLDITVPTSLDNATAANNGFTAALSSLRAEITSQERAQADIERFGRETRAIDIDY